MANHNPKAENLTNAGRGRPLLGLRRTELNLPTETRDRLDTIAKQLGCHRNQAADLLLRLSMGLPIDNASKLQLDTVINSIVSESIG